MLVAVFLPGLLFFASRFPFGSSYSFNVDRDFATFKYPSTKITYTDGELQFGSAVQADKDFNNDGFNDVLASSPGSDSAVITFGKSVLGPISPYVVFRSTAGSGFSTGCAYAGDVNGDGFADIIFGAPTASGGGAAYLVLGAATTATTYYMSSGDPRIITYTPETTGGLFGNSVAGVGDVNQDGKDDFVICSKTFSVVISDAGCCYLIYGGSNLQSTDMNTLGSAGRKIRGATANQQFGSAVSGVGDFNKDGYTDFLVSNGDKKNVFLFYGGSSLSNCYTVSGGFSGVIFPNPTTTADDFGYSISRAGDFNHDGFDDLIISSLSTTTNCQVYVVFGNSSFPASFDLNTLTSSTGVRYCTNAGDLGGASVYGGVDYNLDGFDDIIIGAPATSGNKGAAHVVFGSSSPVDSSVFQLGHGVISLNASTNPNKFGSTVGFAEDVAGANTRGILVVNLPASGGAAAVYFRDFLGTAAPTRSPTTTPTKAPTASPSIEPSFSPSTTPTVNPSEVPSAPPTFIPTSDPTRAPTVSPTQTPTFGPSVIPSVAPSFVPTATPIITPTVVPSAGPTLVPSVDPTMTPTEVPSLVPSFRPSAPTYAPSAVPTVVPTRRTKATIVVNTDLTVNSVNGATLSPTSQETIKQSIANASQTTPNNVDLVSVTRTNRRLLSSVVHRTLATVSLFSYKVVAEIHFNLIDFPGLNESYVAGTKSKGIMQAVKTHEFDRIISYYATINNASQLLNVTVPEVSVSTSFVPVSSSSSEDGGSLSEGQIAGLVIGVIIATMLLCALVFLLLARVRSKPVRSSYDSVPTYSQKAGENDVVGDIATVYKERNDPNLDQSGKVMLTTAPSVVKV
jgi:hypothetical protein